MDRQIEQAQIDTWVDGYELVSQQMESIVGPTVRQEAKKGDRVHFNYVGMRMPQKKEERGIDTVYRDTKHTRRWVATETYDDATLVDPDDLEEILADPGGDYAKSMLAGFSRREDIDAVAAMLGTSYMGKDGTIPVPLPNTQKIPNGGTGFTLTKVLQAYGKLVRSFALMPGDMPTILWTRTEEEAFINTTEVKSIDYNTQRVLVDGEIGGNKFVGFYYKRLEDFTVVDADGTSTLYRQLPFTAGSPAVRSCVAYVKSGIVRNRQREMLPRIAEMPGKRYNYQIYCARKRGYARLKEECAVQIDVTTTDT